MKKRILFVDDDPQMLASLKRMLWNALDRWDPSFVRSGDEALALLARQSHDVIVADIRMPGMDGRGLLHAVRKDYPWMMRVVLSGDSNRESILRSVPEVHQFLTKPVTADHLLGVIERGCRLRDMIHSETIKRIIGKIGSLPAQPEVYTRLLAILEDESACVEDVADVISKDMALSADILKLVNSSFFGPRMKVGKLNQAVTLLGTGTIKALVLGIQMLKVFDTKKIPAFSFPRLWEHSLNTARFARRIAKMEGLPMAAQDDCFIAGMLHDLGKFVLADKLTAVYRQLVDAVRTENLPIAAVEERELGTGHAQAGAYLLGLWGLPDAVLEAVAAHHAPSVLGGSGEPVVTAVHAANALEHELVVINPDYAGHGLDMDYLKRAGIEGRLESWRQACREELENEAPR